MAKLNTGDQAPAFEAVDQHENVTRSADFAEKRLFVFFYPKANTSG